MRVSAYLAVIHSRQWPTVVRSVALLLLVLFLMAVWRVARLYSGFESRVVAFALAFITVQAAILGLLAAGLIAGKAIRQRLEMVRNCRRERLEELLTDALLFGGDRAMLLAECQRSPAEAQAVFRATFLSVRGEVRREAERLFVESGLYPAAVRAVLSSDPNEALTAIALVREVHREDARAAVRAALAHPLPIVQLAARVAVLKNGDNLTRKQILEDAGCLPFWQRLALFYFVPNESGIIRDFLAESLESRDDERILGALEFLLTRDKAFPLPAGVPAGLCDSSNVEVRIKLFRALPLLGDARQALPLLARGLDDPDWRVRSMAAKASGVLRARATRERLFEIVSGAGSPVEVAHAARSVVAMSDNIAADASRLSAACTGENRRVLEEVLGSVRR